MCWPVIEFLQAVYIRNDQLILTGDWSTAAGYQPAQAMWYITLIPHAKHSSLSYKYKINPNVCMGVSKCSTGL